MLERPKLNYAYHAEFIGEDKVLLSSEKGGTILSGRNYCFVLELIRDRGIPVDELVTQLEGKLGMMDVYVTLQLLENEGYITEDVPDLPDEICAYWSGLGFDVSKMAAVLEDKTVFLESIGGIEVEIFEKTFSEYGIKIISSKNDAQLQIVLTDNYLDPVLKQINKDNLASGRPWMLIKPTGCEIWFGPVFVPGETGCHECLHQRLEINNPLNTFYKLQSDTGGILSKPAAALPHSIHFAAGQAAVEIVKWLYHGNNNIIEGKVSVFDAGRMETAQHQLVKRPQCPVCGGDSAKNGEPEPIVLKKSTSGLVTLQGGYREVSPEATVEKYKHHVSKITGVVPSLRPYHSIKDAPVYNYSSGHNIALRSKTLFWLNQHLRSGNGGKGKTWAQAKAGALCESLERYCLSYHGEEYTVRDSLESLGEKAVHPNICMNYSDLQYENREVINKSCSKFFSMVPILFDSSLEMDWSPVYSLSRGDFKYLPSCFLYAQYPAEDELNLFAYPDSNGCAAGNTTEEALLQGFLELIERDAVAIWWYNKLQRPAVDIDSFNEPYFTTLKEFYASINRSLYVIDLTSDLGIPVFAAISHRLDGGKENIIFAFGAHVDARIGVERSLIELNQILPIANVSEEKRAQGTYLTGDKVFVDWLDDATLAHQSYLVPQDDVPAKKAGDYKQLCPPTIYDSVLFCIKAAGKQGLEVLALDLTRRDIGLPVVKVIVPGMRHFWQRLGPGRLYNVPVKMGWLDTPRKEEELNPIGIFI